MFHSLQYLILTITSHCNIHCQYCHQSAGEQGLNMSDKVCDTILNLADNGQPLFIQLTGGEPTMVPDIIERVAQKSRQMTWPPRLAIQTNGTLLTPSLINLFKRYQIQVGVSIDGPPDIQEELRGYADKTLRGIGLLEEADVPFRVTTVITNKNILSLDKLAFMLAGYKSCRGIGLDLLVAKGRGISSNICLPSHEQLHRGITTLVQTLNALNARRSRPILLREMERIKNTTSRGAFCHGASGRSIAVQPDGSLFACGQTIGDPTFSCGSISAPSFANKSPLTTIRLQSHNCDNCPLLKRCPGDCPSRIHYNGVQNSPLICELYRCLDALR
ncbi:MAG: hypothetical protein COA36_06055 [Desulfotalea sp.]|nr:MAG: hypothetical protein COA36_06055 [Desulfotalea sp.]